MKQEDSDLASLPLELVHHISQFLAPCAVLNLSQSCRWLRVALNHNNVWGRYLPDRNITMLENMEQNVNPTLEIDIADSYLCPNLVHFIRKTRLLNNWKRQNVVESPSVELPCDRLVPSSYHREKGSQAMYKDRYIFLARHTMDIIEGVFIDESDMIYAFDVNVAPTLVTTLRLQGCHNGFHVAGNYLIVVIRLVVSVYRIALPEPELLLEYSFAIPENTVTYGNRVNDPWRFSPDDWDHFFYGDCLMSTFCRGGNIVLHVWDAVKATKVGSFPSPIPGGKSMSYHSQFKNYWVFRQEQEEGDEKFFLYFDLDNNHFTRFASKFVGLELHVIFHEKSIILFKTEAEGRHRNAECFVWPLNFALDPKTPMNIQTLNVDKAIAKRCFETGGRNRNFADTIVVGGNFLAYDRNSIHVVDAATLLTLDKIDLADDQVAITNHFDVFGALFVISIGNLYRPDTRLWDVEKRTNRDLQEVDDVYVNSSMTKMILHAEPCVKVLHFW